MLILANAKTHSIRPTRDLLVRRAAHEQQHCREENAAGFHGQDFVLRLVRNFAVRRGTAFMGFYIRIVFHD